MKIWKIMAAVLLVSVVTEVIVFAHPTGNRTVQITNPSINVNRGLNYSDNWAGYIATGGTYTSVSGSWVVPQVSGSGTSSDATWVGIGGTTSNDLIQTGTRAIVNSNGQVSYQAWYEMLPGNSQNTPLTISAGDSITASISKQSTDQWVISLLDSTTGKNYETTVTYTSSLSSAEWIEEMPVLGNSFIPLDNFGSVQFTALSTIKDGAFLTPAQAGAQSVVMVNSLNQVLAQPSTLGSDGASFTVTRTASTPTQTITPQSRTGRRVVIVHNFSVTRTSSTPTQTVAPQSRTGRQRVVINGHGVRSHSRRGQGNIRSDEGFRKRFDD